MDVYKWIYIYKYLNGSKWYQVWWWRTFSSKARTGSAALSPCKQAVQFDRIQIASHRIIRNPISGRDDSTYSTLMAPTVCRHPPPSQVQPNTTNPERPKMSNQKKCRVSNHRRSCKSRANLGDFLSEAKKQERIKKASGSNSRRDVGTVVTSSQW